MGAVCGASLRTFAPGVEYYGVATLRQLKLRRPDSCSTCGSALAAGTAAMWDSARREVHCCGCKPSVASVPPPPVLLESTAGASARREYERRRENREKRVRERLGPLAGIALTLTEEPAHQHAWAKGATGETKLAAKLERWTKDAGVVLLHDRRVPGSRANIDHIAVGPSGVFVIDAKRYKGRIAVERRGGLLRERTEHLLVGGRDQTKLVEGVLGQVEVVKRVLGAGSELPVRAVLCFVDGDWPLFGTLQVRAVPVLPPRKTAALCKTPGPIDGEQARAVALTFAAALPRA